MTPQPLFRGRTHRGGPYKPKGKPKNRPAGDVGRPLWQPLPQLGAPARLLPSPCSLHLCSCCEVRKHCEWCRALICRHEKSSALLKGRTACCHSETGKEAASREDFSLGRHCWVEKRTACFKSGQKFLEGEAERREKKKRTFILPSQIQFIPMCLFLRRWLCYPYL